MTVMAIIVNTRLVNPTMTDCRSAFARTPSSLYSTARLLTRAQTAAFAVRTPTRLRTG